ncbi:hypothetical protein [Sphingobium sp. CFD-2]|uniref:hypothetical protein n=1 Tax=Sphingobium sp. CFD-2 TaxID=2878542 RepID=UPI00214B49F5|nr:hypothetical protein [Sphingobium sp. CFD-2]
MARRPGSDLDISARQAEHAHAGGVFPAGDIVVPAGLAQRDQMGRIIDSGAVIGNAQERPAALRHGADGNLRGRSASSVLEQLVQNIE